MVKPIFKSIPLDRGDPKSARVFEPADPDAFIRDFTPSPEQAQPEADAITSIHIQGIGTFHVSTRILQWLALYRERHEDELKHHFCHDFAATFLNGNPENVAATYTRSRHAFPAIGQRLVSPPPVNSCVALTNESGLIVHSVIAASSHPQQLFASKFNFGKPYLHASRPIQQRYGNVALNSVAHYGIARGRFGLSS